MNDRELLLKMLAALGRLEVGQQRLSAAIENLNGRADDTERTLKAVLRKLEDLGRP